MCGTGVSCGFGSGAPDNAAPAYSAESAPIVQYRAATNRMRTVQGQISLFGRNKFLYKINPGISSINQHE